MRSYTISHYSISHRIEAWTKRLQLWVWCQGTQTDRIFLRSPHVSHSVLTSRQPHILRSAERTKHLAAIEELYACFQAYTNAESLVRSSPPLKFPVYTERCRSHATTRLFSDFIRLHNRAWSDPDPRSATLFRLYVGSPRSNVHDWSSCEQGMDRITQLGSHMYYPSLTTAR